jgi:hypothetical protein
MLRGGASRRLVATRNAPTGPLGRRPGLSHGTLGMA